VLGVIWEVLALVFGGSEQTVIEHATSILLYGAITT
jgi:hypothetical protein